VLDDGIKGRIQQRVDELAAIFFQVVADARETTPEAIADLQAATFLGKEAVRQGVADGIADWDSFLEIVAKSLSEGDPAPLVDEPEEQTTAH
jgi:ClpP class serine protease